MDLKSHGRQNVFGEDFKKGWPGLAQGKKDSTYIHADIPEVVGSTDHGPRLHESLSNLAPKSII